jgi:hypothetical protein
VAEVVEEVGAAGDEEEGKGEAVEEDGDGIEVYMDELVYTITILEHRLLRHIFHGIQF